MSLKHGCAQSHSSNVTEILLSIAIPRAANLARKDFPYPSIALVKPKIRTAVRSSKNREAQSCPHCTRSLCASATWDPERRCAGTAFPSFLASVFVFTALSDDGRVSISFFSIFTRSEMAIFSNIYISHCLTILRALVLTGIAEYLEQYVSSVPARVEAPA